MYPEQKRLKLVSNQDEIAKPAFEIEEAYQKFRQEFADHMRPILEEQRWARLQAEHNARFHIVD